MAKNPPIRMLTDHSPADWIVEQFNQGSDAKCAWDKDWSQLLVVGPRGYAKYARLRFIPDPSHPGQAESDHQPPVDWPSEADVLHWATETLLPFTTTPKDGYLLLWDGAGTHAYAPGLQQAERVEVPHRAYYLFGVCLAEYASGEVSEYWLAQPGTLSYPGGFGWMPQPAYIWPADRAWCITNDVDPHFAGIGASPAAMDALLADRRLDVVRTQWSARQPLY